ncbi:hypothetical protein [Corynebacterium sp.]|nr:hypothetical protein [Corynebacterium sp.]MDO5076734.1 hypothetical protein [Corynebacterium sp.]
MKETATTNQGDLTQLSSALDAFGDIFGTIGVAWFNILHLLNP